MTELICAVCGSADFEALLPSCGYSVFECRACGYTVWRNASQCSRMDDEPDDLVDDEPAEKPESIPEEVLWGDHDVINIQRLGLPPLRVYVDGDGDMYLIQGGSYVRVYDCDDVVGAISEILDETVAYTERLRMMLVALVVEGPKGFDKVAEALNRRMMVR